MLTRNLSLIKENFICNDFYKFNFKNYNYASESQLA
jgi:hypothetical protein